MTGTTASDASSVGRGDATMPSWVDVAAAASTGSSTVGQVAAAVSVTVVATVTVLKATVTVTGATASQPADPATLDPPVGAGKTVIYLV